MRELGIYCYPRVSNTTHVNQDTDQNYVLFKSDYCLSLEIISQARFDIQKTLMISNLPLLVFGGKDEGYIDAIV